MAQPSKTLYLMDGNYLAYRSFYALSGLRASSGEPTNAVYGFINSLLKILREREVDYVACTFDSPGPTFRHRAYRPYKIDRPGMPEDLVRQLPVLKEVLKAMAIEIFEKEGYEADDILATLVKKGLKQGFRIFIISADKDILQLVDKDVFVLKLGDGYEEINPEKVKEILGVYPEKIPALIGLMGDSSDGLPGVPGIGPKTASKLITKFGTIENLYKRLEEINNNTLRDRLVTYREDSFKSLSLARLDPDVPLEIDWSGCKKKELNRPEVIRVFRRLGFNRLIDRLVRPETARSGAPLIFNPSEVLVIFKEDKVKKGLILVRGKDTCLIEKPYARKEVKEILMDGDLKKIGHGFKKILKELWENGLDLKGLHFDLEIASYVLNPERPSHDLRGLSLDYFGKNLPDHEENLIQRLFQLKEKMAEELRESGSQNLFDQVEMPLIRVLAEMERTGVRVSREGLVELSRKLSREIELKEDQIFSQVGERFNLNSTREVSRILFDKLRLPPQKKTKTGYSTDLEVLEVLRYNFPIAGLILSWREFSKLKSTYVDGLLQAINPATGRIHTTFNQTITSTGRLSSASPNLQNIPILGEWGEEIRKIFIAGEGQVLLWADYSQIELRLLAHLSDDRNMLAAFNGGEDIHTTTAREVFNITGEVEEEMRRKAKAINFGLIYGMSSYGLARRLNITEEEASLYIETYFQRYPQVKTYLDWLVKEAEEKGFTATIMGRRRFISPGPDFRRLAVNTPIQGGAADIIKMAMIKISRELETGGFKARMVLQVHDELLFELPLKELAGIKTVVKEAMGKILPLKVPLEISLGCGIDWSGTKDREEKV